jgi:hypothetical protein
MTALTLGHASPPGIEHRESVFFVVGKIVYVADVVHMQFVTYHLAFLLNGGISADAGGFGTNGEYALEIITVRHIPALVTTIRWVERIQCRGRRNAWDIRLDHSPVIIKAQVRVGLILDSHAKVNWLFRNVDAIESDSHSTSSATARAPNGGVDAAARIQSSIAGRIMMRNTPPPLASNDLFDGDG